MSIYDKKKYIFFVIKSDINFRNKLKEMAERAGLHTFVVADAGRTQVLFLNPLSLMPL